MNILLIGCGLTGSAIATHLVNNSLVDKIFLYSRTLKSSKNLAKELTKTKVFTVENLNDVEDVDYIIIALSGISDSSRMESISKRRTTYEVRQDELKYNIGAIAGIVGYLKNIPKNTKIIVVTNPVDELTNYLRITLNNKNVLGFGLELDIKRYSRALGKAILGMGTHGKVIPLINSKDSKYYNKLYNSVDGELMSYIKRNGIPHDVAGKIFSDFFKKLNEKNKSIIHVGYYLDKEFCGIKNISISLPVIASNGKILRIANFKVNNIERDRFQKSAKELQKSVNHILTAHKNLIAYK